MGVCLSCHGRKGRSSDKQRCDVQLCHTLAPLHECITECGALPSGQKATTLPGEQRSEDINYRTSAASPHCLLPALQVHTLHPHDGPINKICCYSDNIEKFNKLYVCNSNGKHSVILSNGHDTTCLSNKDNINFNKCDNNFQSDLIHVKNFSRGSMTMANMKKPNLIKGLVSKQRKRFIDEDFDLDLTYIVPNIIAMGIPADNLEKIYRNSIDDVARFLEEKHKDHYKVYNCSEKSYDTSKFQKRVAEYKFKDHNPPNIELIESFCKDVNEWLNANPNNVAAVHCKAGKGRTGTMISCYLLHEGVYGTAAEALHYYGNMRTHDSKGVTIPSQRRYVEYYAAILKMAKESENGSPVNLKDLYDPPPPLAILRLIMKPPPILNGGQATLEFFVTEVNGPNVCRMSLGTYEFKKGADEINMKIDKCRNLKGDIKIEVYNTKTKLKRKEELFHFWFNTFFVSHNKVHTVREDPVDQIDSLVSNLKLTFTKWELDEAHKDKQNKIFPSDFAVQLCVQRVAKNPNYENMEHGQSSSPASRSHSSNAEEDDSEDSLEAEENWDSGGVVRGESGVLGRYRLLSEPDLEVEGRGPPAAPSSPPAAGPRSHNHACPCPDVDAMLQA